MVISGGAGARGQGNRWTQALQQVGRGGCGMREGDWGCCGLLPGRERRRWGGMARIWSRIGLGFYIWIVVICLGFGCTFRSLDGLGLRGDFGLLRSGICGIGFELDLKFLDLVSLLSFFENGYKKIEGDWKPKSLLPKWCITIAFNPNRRGRTRIW